MVVHHYINHRNNLNSTHCDCRNHDYITIEFDVPQCLGHRTLRSDSDLGLRIKQGSLHYSKMILITILARMIQAKISYITDLKIIHPNLWLVSWHQITNRFFPRYGQLWYWIMVYYDLVYCSEVFWEWDSIGFVCRWSDYDFEQHCVLSSLRKFMVDQPGPWTRDSIFGHLDRSYLRAQ